MLNHRGHALHRSREAITASGTCRCCGWEGEGAAEGRQLGTPRRASCSSENRQGFRTTPSPIPFRSIHRMNRATFIPSLSHRSNGLVGDACNVPMLPPCRPAPPHVPSTRPLRPPIPQPEAGVMNLHSFLSRMPGDSGAPRSLVRAVFGGLRLPPTVEFRVSRLPRDFHELFGKNSPTTRAASTIPLTGAHE